MVDRSQYIVNGQGPLPAYLYHVKELEERVEALEAKLAALEGGRRGRKPAEG